ADQAWVSGLGADCLNAVAAISPYYWIIAGVGAGIGVGATVSISTHLARGDDADSLPLQSLFLSFLLSLLLMACILLTMDPMVEFMGVGEIGQECRDYIVPMVVLCIPLVFVGVFPGIMRGEGAARASMNVNIVTVLANMVLDPLFIYVFGMGISGAGWGTGVASLFGIVYGLYVYRSHRMHLKPDFRGFRPDSKKMVDILVVGIPKTAESMVISVLNMVQRYFLVGVGGIIAVSLYNIPYRYVAMSNVLSMAIGAAMVPVLAAALAVDDTGKAKGAFTYSFRLGMVWLCVLSIGIFVFADYLMLPFLTDASLSPYRGEFSDVLRVYAVFIPFMGMIDIGSSALQAMRKAQLSMLMSLVRNLVIIGLFAIASNYSFWAMILSLFLAELFGGGSMMWLAVRELRLRCNRKDAVGG
ncbi:MAG: polysaccharide biosynthesis C-terminal domain-containing protein, partial [archaeon]|nr:polysaccharide biosynthesis C-terminal domain-containing protein [archaeon]